MWICTQKWLTKLVPLSQWKRKEENDMRRTMNHCGGQDSAQLAFNKGDFVGFFVVDGTVSEIALFAK